MYIVHMYQGRKDIILKGGGGTVLTFFYILKGGKVELLSGSLY